MLKPDLKESGIPGQTILSKRVLELLAEYFDELKDEMKV
jgi:hypothetical protein